MRQDSDACSTHDAADINDGGEGYVCELVLLLKRWLTLLLFGGNRLVLGRILTAEDVQVDLRQCVSD